MNREIKRWSIFSAACIAFGFSLIGLWYLFTGLAIDTAILVFGWIAAPLMTGFTGWLAVKCLKTGSDDPFYDSNPDDIV